MGSTKLGGYSLQDNYKLQYYNKINKLDTKEYKDIQAKLDTKNINKCLKCAGKKIFKDKQPSTHQAKHAHNR
jgi:hypothetical protein